MKAIHIDKFVENYDAITVSEVEPPQPSNGKVVVKVAAAGVNFVDLLYVRGKHQNNTTILKPPFILGLEFAGTIVSTPPTGSSFSVGDRVFGGEIGSYAEQVAVDESSLNRIPRGWTFEEAAGLAATLPVSYGALIVRGGLKRGETVLVHAAAGGLGLMAVQIAKAAGARVIATASSDTKLEIARRFGADECINYADGSEWWTKVLQVTDQRGVDVVYDPVGLVDRSLKCLKHKGRILVVGFAGTEGDLEKIAMNRVLLRQAQIIGYRYGETQRRDPAENAEVWRGVREMLDRGLVMPTVFDKKYRGLESVVAAMRDLSERRVWGKAVISLESNSSVPHL
ncbi:quinone oxidoreductase [Xylogone sp. PMI_703]|nr:quinone oxidoreductase [Xylogone sp. PMI_703]